MPFGKPFYLDGTPDTGAESVQAVVVRKGGTLFWSDVGPNCAEVSKRLQVVMAGEVAPGLHTPDELFQAVNHKRHVGHQPSLPKLPDGVDMVLVTDKWVPRPSPAKAPAPVRPSPAPSVSASASAVAPAPSVSASAAAPSVSASVAPASPPAPLSEVAAALEWMLAEQDDFASRMSGQSSWRGG